MNELHPIEAAWRQCRSSRHVPLLHDSISTVTKLLAKLKIAKLPNEVVLPLAAPLVITNSLQEALRRQHERNLVLRAGCEILANSIHVWASYRESKFIYQIESSLAECFALTSWPDNVPVEVLRLPARCVMLEIPRKARSAYVAAVYDVSIPDPSNPSARAGALNIRLSNFVPSGYMPGGDPPLLSELKAYWVPLCILSLDADTLGASVQQA